MEKPTNPKRTNKKRSFSVDDSQLPPPTVKTKRTKSQSQGSREERALTAETNPDVSPDADDVERGREDKELDRAHPKERHSRRTTHALSSSPEEKKARHIVSKNPSNELKLTTPRKKSQPEKLFKILAPKQQQSTKQGASPGNSNSNLGDFRLGHTEEPKSPRIPAESSLETLHYFNENSPSVLKIDKKFKKLCPHPKINSIIFSNANITAYKAWEILLQYDVHCFPVLSEKKAVIGLLGLVDFCAFIVKNMNEPNIIELLQKTPVESICNLSKLNPLALFKHEPSFREICKKLSNPNVRHVVIVGRKQDFIRYVSQSEVIRFLDAQKYKWGWAMTKTIKEAEMPATVVAAAQEDATVFEAFEIMLRHNTICLAVTDPKTNRIIGQLTVREIKHVMAQNITLDFNISIKDFLQNIAEKITPISNYLVTSDCLIHEVIAKLVSNKSYKLYVVDDDQRPIGTISTREVLAYIAQIDSAREFEVELARRKELSRSHDSYKPLLKSAIFIPRDKLNNLPSNLPCPLVSQTIHKLGNSFLRVGIATMHGWRLKMEDAHLFNLSLQKFPGTAVFGIFDGHGGSQAAKFLARNFIAALEKQDDISENSVKNVFIELDHKYIAGLPHDAPNQGSTAIISFITCLPDGIYQIFNANLGDSRIVFAEKDKKGYKAIACSQDHNASDPVEVDRVRAFGGKIKHGRVDGMLSVTRAFGDPMFKDLSVAPEKQKVIAIPEFMTVRTQSKDAFLVMSCDGIYEANDPQNAFSRQSLVKWIANKMSVNDDPGITCGLVLREAMKKGSQDNMSCFVIQLKDGTNYHRDVSRHIPGPLYPKGYRLNKEELKLYQKALFKEGLRAGLTEEQVIQLQNSYRK